MRRNLEVRILALILAIGLAANSLFTAAVPVRAEGQSGGTAGVAAISAEASVSEEDTDNSASEEKADIEEPEETEAPETEAPETEAETEPETEAPETEAPETEAYETEAPETEAETEETWYEEPETEAPAEEDTASAETFAAETQTDVSETSEEMTEADPADEEETEAETEEETEEAETEEVIEDPLTGEITLVNTIQASDGMTYTISVTCPAEAGIPEDAGLKVKEIKGKNSEAYLEKTAEALAWAEDDVVFYSAFFDISIVEGKYEIQPAAPVQVSIKMLDLAENASAAKKTANALQVVHFDESGREIQAQELNNRVSMDRTDAELTFETDGFSVFGIGGVASKVLGWITDNVSATVLGIAGWFKPKYTASTISDIEEGLEVLEAYDVSGIKPLWINIVRNTVADLGKLESISIYGTKDGKLAEELKANVGFGDDVTVSLDSIDGYALVKDTGLRHRALTLNAGNNTSVALDGMMPKGASAVAEDVTGEADYSDALAAVDITIRSNNEEYQPEAGSPISVNIYNTAIKEAIAAGTGIEVWHVKDDGAEEKVENVSLTEDGVGFAAEGFSKYIVREVVLDGTITAGDGKTYKVTVTYDPECGIPADAKLKVSEVTDGTDTYLEETAKALHLSVEDLGFSRLFDISIVGKDGTEYQPNEAVTVKVELLDAAEEDTEDLHVVHFGENENAKELAAQADGSVVTFETDGFSVFSFAGISLLERVFEAVLGKSSNTIFENDDIVLTGKMPALGVVEANPVNVQVNGQDALVAYDIKIYANPLMKMLGIAWQPTAGAIQVKIKSDALNTDVVSVYHMEDENSEPELVSEDVAVEEGTVTFDAESFSIYPIIPGDTENGRIIYKFWAYDAASDSYKTISTQYFRYVDVQTLGSRIKEPSIPGVSQADMVRIFEGWHLGAVTDGKATFGDTVTVSGLNEELAGKTRDQFVEGTEINVIAKLKDAYYITYVDVNSSSVLATDLVIKEESGNTTFEVKADVKPTKYEEDLKGWKKLEDIEDDSATLYETGNTYVIDSNITLAPVIEGGYWLVFDDNDLVDDGTGNMVSGGASYTPPVFYMNSSAEQQPTVKPSDPEWTGYAFGGWYEDAGCTTEFTFGGLLTKNTTVYAKWTPAASSYSVIIWKQPTDPKATDYDFAQSFTINENVTTGDLVYLDAAYTKIYGEDGTSTDLDKQYFVYNQEKTDQYIIVAANGSSVFNVYYDRVPMSINFYTWGNGYVYTETESEDGTQYGIVGDQYVPLRREAGEETVYSYTYSPNYVATTSDYYSPEYGIIDGEYKELERVSDTTYRPYYNYTAATGTNGTQYGVVDGEFVELKHGYTYSWTGTGYDYTPTEGETGTQFGIVNGEYVQLSKNTVYSYTWWRNNNNQYTGALYPYYSNTPTGYTTSTRFIYNIPDDYYREWRTGALTARRDVASADQAWVDSNGAEYTGTRYTRTVNTGTHNYTGPYYRQRNNGWYEEVNNPDNYNSVYALVDGEYIRLTRNGPVWSVASTGETYTGNRYTRTRNNNGAYNYAGTRYTRTGSSAPYNYTETASHGGTQYGVVTADHGHVQLESNTSSYSYYYNGEKYTGTRYYTPNNNPVDYSGTRYTLDNGTYHVTSTNGDNLYGRDSNGVFRELRALETNQNLWKYTDPNTGEEKEYTGTRYTRSNNTANSWQLYKSFTGVYGATFEQYGYSWPTDYDWYENGHGTGGNQSTSYYYGNGDTSGSRMTLKTTFEPLEGELDVKFYGRRATTTGASIIFYKQQLDGSYVQADEIKLGGNSGTFHINDKYTGFHAAQYSLNGGSSWTNVTPKGSDGYYGSAVSYDTNGLRIRFDRNDYDLVFFPDPATGAEPITYSIPYEQSISSYANQSPGQKAGHYFIGWFADDQFKNAFNFNQKMPDHNVSVFGQWRMERIRVLFVPGADNVYIDPAQSMSFRLNYDERIDGSMVSVATRPGYILDGWYTDPEFTNKFIFTTPVTSATEGVDMTYQTSSRWASIRNSYGDNTEQYSNVRGIITLYAKWNIDTEHKGYDILYDAGEAGIHDGLGNLTTKVPVDPRLYQKGADVITGAAPENYSELYEFQYWQIVNENGEAVGEPLHTGTHFTITEQTPVFSKTTDPDSGEPLVQTIKLKAIYTKSEEAAARFTTITYNGNTFSDSVYPEGSETLKGRANDGSEQYTVTLDKEINETIVLPEEGDFYLNGYKLVGWSFFEGTYEQQIAQAQAWNAAHADKKVLEKFSLAQEVAADNLDQSTVNDKGNILYAMWQPKTYKVTVKQVVEDGVPVNSFNYPYKYGVENQLSSAPLRSGTLTLTGDSSQAYGPLEYYGRVGHVFNITTPNIAETADYAVRVNAIVTRDDGSRETLDLNSLGNYEILGDVEITYTYSLKVPVTLEKRALNDKSLLTGSKFVLTPVAWNGETQRWDVVGTTTFEYDMSGVSFLTKRLQEGVYRVNETKAPTDYAMMGEPVLLTVRKNQVFLLRTTSGDAVSEKVAELTGSDKHTLTVYDRPIRQITIQKIVDGDDLEPNGYTFSAEITLEGSPMKQYDTVGNGVAADITNGGGVIEFKVKNGESKTLNIPWGAEITVTENNYRQYEVKISSDITDYTRMDSEHRIFQTTVNEKGTVTYTNKKNLPAPTGLKLLMSPFLWMLVLGFAILFIGKVRPETLRRIRKRGDADD